MRVGLGIALGLVAAAPLTGAAPANAPAAPVNASKKDVAPAVKAQTQFLEGLGRTPEEEQLLEELSQTIERYEAETKEFRKEIQLLVEKKYEEKRNSLANSYEKAIRDMEVVERRGRLDAIAQFEEFLKRYPDDRRYTPDVMFRLGELYYERSSDAHIVAMREYEDRLKAAESKKEGPP